MHAFVNGLGRSSEMRQTIELYREVETLFGKHDLLFENSRGQLVLGLTADVMAGHDLPDGHAQFQSITELVEAIIGYERLFVLPDIHFDRTYTTAQHWEFRDELNRQRRLAEHYDETYRLLHLLFCSLLEPVYAACPSLKEEQDNDGITIPTDLTHMLGHAGSVVERIAKTCSADDLNDTGILEHIRAKLDYNLIIASGGNPADPRAMTRAPKFPAKSDIRDPKELVEIYLGGTPLASYFNQKASFTIPTKSRFEHHHIIAGSGHGKTQTLQYLLSKDVEAVARGERSVVVIDSQGDLINTVSNRAVFAPGGPLHDRIVVIDPTDIEYPVSLNLFDVGQERLEGYAPLERERLTNSVLELYDFVLGTLLSAEMTQKQSVIFRYVTRLMLHIPNATIHTLRELMEPNAEVKYADSIAELTGSARHFFDTEFSSREFEQTKKQVLRRLWGILENQTFERMFSHPKSKLDLFSEMNAGKVILINTAKDLLKESGTEIFGRFFIALIAQAAQERATLPTDQRMPTMVYIDEAADYFDRNIGIILSQARKYGVGMVLAHQFLGQLDTKLQDAFAANTSIKFAGGVSAKDARVLASQMGCEPDLIESQGKGSYAASVRGLTKNALPLQFPFGVMEKLPRMRQDERDALQELMRERYAVHYSELNLGGSASPNSNGGKPNEPPEEPDDPLAPTPHW
ncbi:hypothetical protein [uncultured Litoreibacter sp.]|uniref:type IV secretory system conjugative DNA transfer family protein n=1 Tax=uncultured Litoreibacter sp. TaxID=1392394 RepID=UPI002628DE3F|nr:hypothetical protein [uncultured Litoreibacter sp.]